MKKLVLACFLFLFLFGQTNGFGAPAVQFDEINPLTLLSPSLTVKAHFYYGNEDEDKLPVAETEFYLLDKSLVDILKNSNFKPQFPDGKRRKLKANDYLTAAAKAFSSGDEESALIALLIKAKIAEHQINSLKTDYSGLADLKTLKMGTYYVFGIGKTEAEIFVWHFALEIQSCKNVIELDQYNAEAVFSADE